MRDEPCPELRRRLCPFISCGEHLVYCRGVQCNACRPVPIDDGTVWVCALIDQDFAADRGDMHGPEQ